MLDASVYEQRRQRALDAMGDRDVALFISGPERVRSRDTHHRYRASSDVIYLTGFEEPEAVVVLAPGHPSGPLIMFVRPRDEKREIWDGRRAGPQGAIERYGADSAYNLDQLDAELPMILEGAHFIHHHFGQPFDAKLTSMTNRLRFKRGAAPQPPQGFRDARDLMAPLRLIKQADEIEALRRSCALTAEAHLAAMRACKPGMHEYELQAIIEYVFLKNGARAPAYESIVGAGANATVLHYIENRDVIKDGDLVLIDAGAELDYYAGDITRTFPANGRFSPIQRDLYQAVLDAEIAAIDACVVGASWLSIHEATVARLTQSMVDLGLLEGDVDALIEDKAYTAFYMHKTGHYLGIDVHDVGPYYEGQDPARLVPGVVQTIEPGIYIQPGAPGVDEAFWGIGIRIEDDVLTTEQGPEILTGGVPKSVEDVEAVVGTGFDLPI